MHLQRIIAVFLVAVTLSGCVVTYQYGQGIAEIPTAKDTVRANFATHKFGITYQFKQGAFGFDLGLNDTTYKNWTHYAPEDRVTSSGPYAALRFGSPFGEERQHNFYFIGEGALSMLNEEDFISPEQSEATAVESKTLRGGTIDLGVGYTYTWFWRRGSFLKNMDNEKSLSRLGAVFHNSFADLFFPGTVSTYWLRLEGHMRKTTFKESYRLPMMDAKHSAMNEAYITLGIGTGVE